MNAGANLFVGAVWVVLFVWSGEVAWLACGMFLLGLGFGRLGAA